MSEKVGMISLGCAKNRVDSECMLAMLRQSGYEVTDRLEEADAIVINTCGFIESAQMEGIETILETAELKKEGRLKALVVSGCMSEVYRDEIKKEMPEVDAVIGTGSYDKVVEAVSSALAGKFYSDFSDKNIGILPYTQRILSTPTYTAYIKIAEGCSNACAFCKIPQIRGRLRSREIDDIVQEARKLCEGGVKEIILIAQDVTRYKTEKGGQPQLGKLLRELSGIEGLRWIRLHYLYPDMITRELMETIAGLPKVVRYFDIPVQHISDRVLAAMRRHGGSDTVRQALDLVREYFPEGAVRTTLMVGFPGEEQEDYEELVEFVKEYGFDRLGVFAFSPQEGTLAYGMTNQVKDDIKEIRRDEIMRIQMDISARRLKDRVGSVYEVLVEGRDEDGRYVGRSYLDSIEVDGQVIFESDEELSEGDFADVEITSSDDYNLMGRMISRR